MTTKIFHDLAIGDVVSAYGTTLEVVAVEHNSPVYHFKTDDGITSTRTLVTFQDLRPELGRTYPGPWQSGLITGYDEYYRMAD